MSNYLLMRVTESSGASSVFRRSQIIQATIVVVARVGAHGASYERIRAEAAISSTRLISYHFESRDELFRATLATIVAEAASVMSPAIATATTSRLRLAAYIRANLGFLADRPNHAAAAVEIVSLLSREGADDASDPTTDLLADAFARGQRDGELREFDVDVMAITVRAAIDRAVTRFVTHPHTDLSSYADELVELFDRGIRLESLPPSERTEQ